MLSFGFMEFLHAVFAEGDHVGLICCIRKTCCLTHYTRDAEWNFSRIEIPEYFCIVRTDGHPG